LDLLRLKDFLGGLVRDLRLFLRPPPPSLSLPL